MDNFYAVVGLKSGILNPARLDLFQVESCGNQTAVRTLAGEFDGVLACVTAGSKDRLDQRNSLLKALLSRIVDAPTDIIKDRRTGSKSYYVSGPDNEVDRR